MKNSFYGKLPNFKEENQAVFLLRMTKNGEDEKKTLTRVVKDVTADTEKSKQKNILNANGN